MSRRGNRRNHLAAIDLRHRARVESRFEHWVA
jgi:hypothetical protein